MNQSNQLLHLNQSLPPATPTSNKLIHIIPNKGEDVPAKTRGVSKIRQIKKEGIIYKKTKLPQTGSAKTTLLQSIGLIATSLVGIIGAFEVNKRRKHNR